MSRERNNRKKNWLQRRNSTFITKSKIETLLNIHLHLVYLWFPVCLYLLNLQKKARLCF